MESRLERLQRRRQTRREWQDHGLGRLAEAVVLGALLYLLARSPFGRDLLQGLTALTRGRLTP